MRLIGFASFVISFLFVAAVAMAEGTGGSGGSTSGGAATSGGTGSPGFGDVGSTSDGVSGNGTSGSRDLQGQTAPRTTPAARPDENNTAPRTTPPIDDEGGAGSTGGAVGDPVLPSGSINERPVPDGNVRDDAGASLNDPNVSDRNLSRQSNGTDGSRPSERDLE
jgi:hypothetical protein